MTFKTLLLATAAVSISGLSYTALAGDCGWKAAKAALCSPTQTVSVEGKGGGSCSPAQTVSTEGKAGGACSPASVVSTEGKAGGACSPASVVSTDKKEGACSSATVSGDVKKSDGCCGPKNLATVIAKHDKLTTLAGLLKSSGLDKDLAGEKKLTIFAPTDEAFAKLPEATLEMLAKPENKDQLKAILTSHVVDGANSSCCFTDGQVVKAASGQELTVTVKDGKVSVNGAKVTTANVEAGNGMVHAIDTVILPVRG